jgi:undecaprenyl-diphosphatase
MFSVFDSIILGFIQGITEFLPISSSGHLIIARDILGISQEGGLAFDAILQLATACAVLVYFRKDIWDLIINLFSKTKDKTKNTLTICLIVGTIPAIILGLLLEEYMDTVFRNISLVALTLLIGSVIMFIADKVLARRLRVAELRHPREGGDPMDSANLTISKSLIIGLFQSLALIPGMSRSGMSISGGYIVGLSKEMAVRFGFLLSIPIIVGSGLVKLSEIIKEPTVVSGGSSVLIAGFISAFIFGWLAIDFLLKFLKTNSFKVFVWYRVGLALLLLIFFV